MRRDSGRWLALVMVVVASLLISGCGKEAVDRSESPEETLQRAQFVMPAEADRERLLNRYAEAIRGLNFDYGKVGSVLEALGFVELKKRFPAPRYEVVARVQYFNQSGRTLGEIDLAVVDVAAGSVLVVYQAKLSGNPRMAGVRADEQNARFMNALAAGEISRLKGREGDYPLETGFFSDQTLYLKMGGRESESFGWDVVIDLQRAEGDQLQAMVRGGEAIPSTRSRDWREDRE